MSWPASDLPLNDPRHPFHLQHMEMPLHEAAAAAEEDEFRSDPTAHAERIAKTQGASALGCRPLENCIRYVTAKGSPSFSGLAIWTWRSHARDWNNPGAWNPYGNDLTNPDHRMTRRLKFPAARERDGLRHYLAGELARRGVDAGRGEQIRRLNEMPQFRPRAV